MLESPILCTLRGSLPASDFPALLMVLGMAMITVVVLVLVMVLVIVMGLGLGLITRLR